MREILFRGRDIAHNWHYGVPLIFSEDYVCMSAPHTYNKKVESYTLGQYTGLTDKNGKKIFEGDIIQFCQGMKLHYIVEFDSGRFMLSRYDTCGEIIDLYNCPCEVIGNIHDDPELRKSVMNK